MAKNRKGAAADLEAHRTRRAAALASLRSKRTKPVSLGDDGITAWIGWTVPDDVEITPEEATAAAFEPFVAPDWQAELTGITERCAEVLRREGLSHPEWTVHREAQHAVNVSKTFSDAWFAGRLALLAYLIRLADKDGVSAHPTNLTRILDLGHLLGHWQLLQQIREDTLRGKEVPRNARKGGEAADLEKHEPHRRKVLAAMDREMTADPTLRYRKAAKLVFKAGLGTSADANRKLWERHRGC